MALLWPRPCPPPPRPSPSPRGRSELRRRGQGISDLAIGILSYVKGRFHLCEIIDLPLGYQSGHQVIHLRNAFYQKFQPKELADTRVIYLHGHGPGILHTKEPVSKLEDLKGLKIRCTGTSSKIVEALGSTPVVMPQTETYDVLQKGLVNGHADPYREPQGLEVG